MATEQRLQVIDADAHVVETERTWEYLDPGEERYRPTLYTTPNEPGRAVWGAGGQFRSMNFNDTREQLAELHLKHAPPRHRLVGERRELREGAATK